ncbi:hypothetical protein GCM10010924_60720 [Rhizobium wenxiniae]|nr:hypothetical protein GCM10010924_60720 [Rhizobium wenxiniae]
MTMQLQSQFVLRCILPAFASMLLCGLLFLSLSWAAARSDEVAVARQRDLVTLTVVKLKAGIAHDQESATVWDDAVKNTQSGNLEWIKTNLGSWMHSYFGHDAALVLRSNLTPLYRFTADAEYSPSTDDLRKAK